MKNKLFHPLMKNNITNYDKKELINFIKKSDKFTNGPKVKEFEKKWSNWLGVKYSVFVNSGSSANLLSLAELKLRKGVGEIIVPPLTWSSDIYAIIHNGFKPVFVDINFDNLGMNEDEIKKNITRNTKAIFVTHILGLNCLTDKIVDICKKYKIELIEDCCESHGANFGGQRIGSIGYQSNFSFYYAHHMSTIEGGMVCTNSYQTYQNLKMLRSHGMVRECDSVKIKSDYEKKYPHLNKDFIFAFPSYNMRSTELNAQIGITQLKSLDKNNKKRIKNFKNFLKFLDNKKFYTNFNIKGSVNYGLIILLKKKYANMKNTSRLEKIMFKNKIEFRRGLSGGGDQTQQPYFKVYKKKNNCKIGLLKNIKFIHKYSYYIGNYPSLSISKIKKICKILNQL
jgi:CDP-6-deoxy-D-xylo-4-hexulose-3-dehydrase